MHYEREAEVSHIARSRLVQAHRQPRRSYFILREPILMKKSPVKIG